MDHSGTLCAASSETPVGERAEQIYSYSPLIRNIPKEALVEQLREANAALIRNRIPTR